MGANANPKRKAADDFAKRSATLKDEDRARTAFVFVTPRRWNGAHAWAEAAAKGSGWREVRAYDATALEHWLEGEGATAFWFAERLGIAGPGIHPPEQWWQRWAEQTAPAITREAAFAGRDVARDRLVQLFTERPSLIGLRADSAEEAAAFACAVALSVGVVDAVVVSTPEAWRFVDANPSIRLVIPATPEVAAERTPRAGATLVVPLGTTDTAARTRGSAVSAQEAAVRLTRPHKHEFRDALVEMGVEGSDAERLAYATGRSWPVYRRLGANNPAVARPGWLDKMRADALVVVCLVGAWSAGRAGDRAVVAAVGGRGHEALERDLLSFADIDDAPLLKVGEVWKARSPLELLHLIGPQISTAQIDRYFDVARAVLSKPDPALALEPEQRWAAAIHGAAREESGLVIDALGESLARLAVEGPLVPHLNDCDPGGRVARLVRELLDNADADRWYSLTDVLPELAEAAPHAFLQAAKAGLSRADGGPLSLLRATGEGGPLAGGCRHASLLWALERLAWNPALLPSVADLLARMADEPLQGNWANTPFNSLLSLLRPWWPQTTATDEQRLALVDRLRSSVAHVAWRLMLSCVDTRGGFASANAQPRWRDDDAGAPGPDLFLAAYAYDLVCRVLDDANGHTDRLGELLREMSSYGPAEQQRILDMVAETAAREAAQLEALRAGLRAYLRSRHRDPDDIELEARLARARTMLAELEPTDAIEAARWLFDDVWMELPLEPGETEEDSWTSGRDRVEERRVTVVKAVLKEHGINGVERLISMIGQPYLVGCVLPQLIADDAELASFVLNRDHPLALDVPGAQVVGALLRRLDQHRMTALLTICAQQLELRVSSAEPLAALYALAPNERAVWTLVDGSPEAVRTAYWRRVPPTQFLRGDELAELTTRLLAAGRPRSALFSASLEPESLQAPALYELLDRVRRGEEADGPMPDSWNLRRAFDRLDEVEDVPSRDVALLQFAFFEALRGPGRDGGDTLILEVLSDPELFTELITFVYRAASSSDEASPDDNAKAAASIAWHVLRELKRLPGQSGAHIDAEAFKIFVHDARELCKAADRAAVADLTLGEAFAYSPEGEDHRWPHECVRAALELEDAEDLRRGFATGIFNKRGVFSRGLDEGGAQERELSERYNGFADALALDSARTEAVLREVADRYSNHALREDIEARMRFE